jgi:hypothetical protein
MSEQQLEAQKFLNNSKSQPRQTEKWTFNLVFCCLVVSLMSFQFGYNISSLNPVTSLVKDFIRKEFFLFNEYYVKSALFNEKKGYLEGNKTKLKDAMHEVESSKSRFMDCLMVFDYDCQNEILTNSKNKQKQIYEKYGYNMTVEEFIKNRTALLEEKEKLLMSYVPLLQAGKAKVDKVTDIIWTSNLFFYSNLNAVLKTTNFEGGLPVL